MRDSYLMPWMYECIEFLKKAAVFCTLDASNGPWQVEVYETNSENWNFRSTKGQPASYKFLLAQKNAPRTFFCATDIILLAVKKWQLDLVYVKNIVIFSRSPHNHIEQVQRVLSLLQGAGTILRLKNCSSFYRQGLLPWSRYMTTPTRDRDSRIRHN